MRFGFESTMLPHVSILPGFIFNACLHCRSLHCLCDSAYNHCLQAIRCRQKAVDAVT